MALSNNWTKGRSLVWVRWRKRKGSPGGEEGKHWWAQILSMSSAFGPAQKPSPTWTASTVPLFLFQLPCYHQRAFHRYGTQLLSALVSLVFPIFPCPIGHSHTSVAYILLHLKGTPLPSLFLGLILCSSFHILHKAELLIADPSSVILCKLFIFLS